MVGGRVSGTGVLALVGCGAEARSINEEIWSDAGAELRGGSTGGIWARSATTVLAAVLLAGFDVSEAAMVGLTGDLAVVGSGKSDVVSAVFATATVKSPSEYAPPAQPNPKETISAIPITHTLSRRLSIRPCLMSGFHPRSAAAIIMGSIPEASGGLSLGGTAAFVRMCGDSNSNG